MAIVAFSAVGGGALLGAKFRLHEIRVGLFGNRLGGQHDCLQRAFVDQPVDHAHADAGFARGLAFAAHHAVGEKLEHARTRRGHARRRRAGKLDASALALRAEMLAHAQAHAQHHAARRHGVIGHPIDEAAQLRPQRRHIEFFLDVLEPIIEPRIGLRVLRPHHRGGLARAQGHRHHVARREVQLLRHPVRIGPVERDRDQHIDDASGHAGILGRFRGV